MGRDIAQKTIEELIDKRLRIYHSTHSGGGGDTPTPTSKAAIVFERPFEGTYDGIWHVSVGGTDDTQGNRLNDIFETPHDNDPIFAEFDGGLAEIKNPAYIPVGFGNASKYCFYCFDRVRGLDNLIDQLMELNIVKYISMTNDYYLVTDIWLTNTSYSGQIFPQNDWIVLRNVNIDAFMSEAVEIDDIECYKLSNLPISSSTYNVIRARIHAFMDDHPELHYDDRTWSMYMTNVPIDINALKQTTGRDNFYEVIL